MTPNTVKAYPKWLHSLNTIDSTNIYANKLIADGLAQHGDVVWALEQTQGKGQRGKTWEAHAYDNIFMSLILKIDKSISRHPQHLGIICPLILAQYFNIIEKDLNVRIKWPNDIFINAKKTAGILIENLFQNNDWTYSVVGIGINVNQASFPKHLNKATSLKVNTGKSYDLLEIITDIRAGILNALIQYNLQSFEPNLNNYNDLLFGKEQMLNFKLKETDETFEAKILGVDFNGKLHLETTDGILQCQSGSLIWVS